MILNISENFKNTKFNQNMLLPVRTDLDTLFQCKK